jgi:hypothetical protein
MTIEAELLAKKLTNQQKLYGSFRGNATEMIQLYIKYERL